MLQKRAISKWLIRQTVGSCRVGNNLWMALSREIENPCLDAGTAQRALRAERVRTPRPHDESLIPTDMLSTEWICKLR